MAEKGGGGRAAVAIALLVLAVAAVALLLARSDDGPETRPVAAVSSSSGAGGPVVALDPAGAAAADPHGQAPGLAGEPVATLPDGAAPGAGPDGLVVDGRAGGAAAADPATRATGLRGRVVEQGGAPVAGARVSVRGARPGAGGMTVMTLKPGPDGELEVSSPGEVRVEATSDADGRFEVEGLDAAFKYSLVAAPPEERAEDLLNERRPAPRLQAGQVVDAGELRLPRAARLSGTVRDAAGRPVPEATVRLGGEGPMMFGGPGEGEGAPAGGFAVRKAVRVAAPAGPDGGGDLPLPELKLGGGQAVKTDAAGRYTLTRVRPGKQTITASKPGHRTARRDLKVAEGEAKDDVDLALGEPLAVTVLVVDAEGRPIAGASVQVDVGFGPRLAPSKAQRTDAQGLARVDGLSTSEVTLSAGADGHATATQEAKLGPADPDTPRRLVLRSGCAVTLRLVRADDGAPVTRGVAFLEPLVHGPDVEVRADAANKPDAEGRIRLSGVAPGRYRLRAQSPGLAGAEVRCEVPEGVTTHDLGDVKLGALAGLDVLVLDPDGAPVEGASVDASPAMMGGMVIAVGTSDGDGPPVGKFGRSASTGPDGRARLDGLEPGTLVVRASKAPFADGTQTVAVSGGGTRGEVQVSLARPGRIEGRVVGLEPGQKVRVSLLRRDGGPMPVAAADVGPDGAFAFERVAPGEYGLTTGGHGAPPPAWFTLAEGETVSRSVDVAPTATVEGTVTDAQGVAVAGAQVAVGWLDVWHAGDPGLVFAQASVTTDGLGRFRLTGVRPQPGLGLSVGTATVKALYRVDVPSAATVRRDVRLPAGDAGCTLRVRVSEPDRPSLGATVTLERTDDGPYVRREATTDEAGAVAFEAVPSGRYTVSAVARGFARARATLDLQGAAGATIDGPTLALTPGGALVLQVTGSGTGEARLVVRPEGSTIASDAWFTGVELGGQVRIDGLEVGARYEVRASAPGHRDAIVVVPCDRPDPQAPLVIQLQPGS